MKDGKFIGIMCFADDMEEVETSLKLQQLNHKVFSTGSQFTSPFTYLGIEVCQDEDKSVTIDQNSYVQSINLMPP